MKVGQAAKEPVVLINACGDLLQRIMAPCLIVGGIYKMKCDYCRIDFIRRSSDGGLMGKYMSLLRNCRYEVIVDEMLGPGCNTLRKDLSFLPHQPGGFGAHYHAGFPGYLYGRDLRAAGQPEPHRAPGEQK